MTDTEILNAVSAKYTMLIEYDIADQPIYIGEAISGTATSEASWRIQYITWVAGNATSIKWASGTPKFDKVWDSRATYTYS